MPVACHKQLEISNTMTSHTSTLLVRRAQFQGSRPQARRDTHVSSILEACILPQSRLLPVGGGKAGLEPEEYEARQPQQLQRLLDEGLDEDEGHEEGGSLWGRGPQCVDDLPWTVDELRELV